MMSRYLALSNCRRLTSSPPKPLSPSQLRVLRLYRSFLRVLNKKDLSLEDKRSTQQEIRRNFEKNRNLSKIAVNQIDFLVRQGEKKLTLFQDSATASVAAIRPKTHHST
eukprot:GABV01005351.1.p1 GENE.GABV01005351.1~~GABV01005351.1.p1  ORF type:complete len:109 (+),score=27.26 GABV01005351.1:18-344(+)